MTTELYWLAVTATTVAFFGLPYGVNGMIINGPLRYMEIVRSVFNRTAVGKAGKISTLDRCREFDP